jgi:hypothetical protein
MERYEEQMKDLQKSHLTPRYVSLPVNALRAASGPDLDVIKSNKDHKDK